MTWLETLTIEYSFVLFCEFDNGISFLRKLFPCGNVAREIIKKLCVWGKIAATTHVFSRLLLKSEFYD